MRIWLITTGEPVPQAKGGRDRLYRTGYFAHYLADQGHTVVWWTSCFDHFRKCHIGNSGDIIRPTPNLEIRLLWGDGYRRNLSFARIRDHRQVARDFRRTAINAIPPDVILCAMPTIELCFESVHYAHTREIPIVLDMRDMWPDIFVDSVLGCLRPFARLAIRPLLRQAREACRGATAITGITEAFLEWGVSRAGRVRGSLDRAFPMAYSSVPPSGDDLCEAARFWDSLGVEPDSGFTVCFIGTIGRQFELATVLDAAGCLEASGRSIRFVLCGNGDRFEYFRNKAVGLRSVIFPGRVGAAAIHVLMHRSALGLDPLQDRYDFLATINNKAIEYISAGLPVLSSPNRGTLRNLLYQCGCGLSVPSGDAKAMAEALGSLYDDPIRLKRMANRARDTFDAFFRAEIVYRDFMLYLEEVVQVHRGRRGDRGHRPDE